MDAPKKKDKSLKRIKISDVKLGMYLEDVVDDNGLLLLSSKDPVRDTDQIEQLKKRGIRTVLINIDRKENKVKIGHLTEVALEPEIDPKKREEEYYKELDVAVQVHKSSVMKASEAMKAVRAGFSFSMSRIESAAEEIINSLLRNPDALISLSQLKGYDNYTYIHSVNVSILVASLANTLGYSKDRLFEIGIGGLLHDIGKMRIPDNVLNKPGKLTDTEFAIIKRHPEFGIEAVINKRGISDLSKKIILQHHERYNGKGYPLGLSGERIHEVGLISAVADVYDALTSDRIYKSAWTPQKALLMIFKGCDQEYSRRIVELFTKHMGIYPVGSFVKLYSNEMGVVVRVRRGQLLTPEVLILIDKNGNRLKEPLKVLLGDKQKLKGGDQYKIEVSLNPKAFNINVNDYIQKRY